PLVAPRSFPTRRSSDLRTTGAGHRRSGVRRLPCAPAYLSATVRCGVGALSGGRGGGRGGGLLGAAPLHGTGVVDKRLESGLVLLEAVDTGVDLTNSAFPGELDALSRLDLLLANGVGVAVRAREDLGDHGRDFPSIDRVNGADRLIILLYESWVGSCRYRP